MEKMIYDESNGLWYELLGDYYIPCITLAEEEQQPIGTWGQRHADYLREYRKLVYMELLTSGKLNGYLAEIDKQAESMYFQLIKQYAIQLGVTEQLKKENQMKWIGEMNNIQACVREVVYNELIYV